MTASRTLFGLIALLFLFFGAYFFIGFPRGSVMLDRGTNAIWLEHGWAEDQKSIEEIRTLVTRLGEHRIRTVFLHVGPIESSGTIPEARYKAAKRFLDIARTFTDNMEFHAWMGQIRSKLDIKNSAVVSAIAKTASTMTNVIGFDGIHMDIEPVIDHDDHYVFLLKEIRRAVSETKKLSVAMPEILTPFAVKLVSLWMQPTRYVSMDYYAAMAEAADAIAVMAYESGITKEWLYRYFVMHQIIWATRAVPDRKIFIGIPTFDAKTKAENLENALLGIRRGLKNIRSYEQAFSGVAIFRYGTTEEKEWNRYRELWLP